MSSASSVMLRRGSRKRAWRQVSSSNGRIGTDLLRQVAADVRARQEQQFVDQPDQPVAFIGHIGEDIGPVGGRDRRVAPQEIEVSAQRRQRGAQFVRDVHHEVALLLERERHALVGVLQAGQASR